MDTSASVQMRGFQEPQIERVEMAHWHRVASVGPPLEVESLELCHCSSYGLWLLDCGTSHTLKPLQLLYICWGGFPSLFVNLDILLHFVLLVQLPYEAFIQHVHFVSVYLKALIELTEWLQCLRDCDITACILNLNVERYGHKLKRAFLVQVAKLLHHKKQIVLLREQLVLFKVIYHLVGHLVLPKGLHAS